ERGTGTRPIAYEAVGRVAVEDGIAGIGDVEGPALADDDGPEPIGRERVAHPLRILFVIAGAGHDDGLVSVDQPDAHGGRGAEARRALRHRVEYRLVVGRRLADHAQDLGGGHLALALLAQLAAARLPLLGPS